MFLTYFSSPERGKIESRQKFHPSGGGSNELPCPVADDMHDPGSVPRPVHSKADPNQKSDIRHPVVVNEVRTKKITIDALDRFTPDAPTEVKNRTRMEGSSLNFLMILARAS